VRQSPPHDISLTWTEVALLLFAGACAIGVVLCAYLAVTR
jgi:hypothetical protein